MVFISIFKACDVLCVLFGVCEFCQRISNSFSEIEDLIEQTEWYRFPNEVNRMLPAILLITQQPVGFLAFGSISCTRSTFKTVSSNSTTMKNCAVLSIIDLFSLDNSN